VTLSTFWDKNRPLRLKSGMPATLRYLNQGCELDFYGDGWLDCLAASGGDIRQA
jgi:hypothetical protein